MINVIFDTNIYIDFFNVGGHCEHLLSKRYIHYLSSIVLLELYAGAHTEKDHLLIDSIKKPAEQVNKIVYPSVSDYIETGKLLSRLRQIGIESKKVASITYDCLLAVSAASANTTLITSNKKDFDLICKVKELDVVYL